MGLLVLIACLLSMALGSLAILVTTAGYWWGIAVLLAAVLWIAKGRFERYMDKRSTERRNYVRGEEGEQLVSYLLETLPDTVHVFHGLQLVDGADLDHVVVFPGGVWVISTKNLRGYFSQSLDRGFLRNGKPAGDLLRGARRQAVELKERLKALVQDDLYVQAVLAVPWGYVEVKNPVDHVYVVHREDLTYWMERAPVKLSQQQVDRYVKAVGMLAEMSRAVARKR